MPRNLTKMYEAGLCNRCGKPLDGQQRRCSGCRLKDKEYRDRHKVELQSKRQKWVNENQQRVRERQKQWMDENRQWVRERQRQWRAANPAKVLSYIHGCNKASQRKRRCLLRNKLDEIKLKHGCLHPNCQWKGTFLACQLDFHHINGQKSFNLGQTARSIASIVTELAKCTVICACCHRQITWGKENTAVSFKTVAASQADFVK